MSFPNYSSQRGEPKTSPDGIFAGRGVGIAFLDTGISPVADFITPQNRIIVFRDFVNGKRGPYDDNGHGTHVAYSNHKKIYQKNTEKAPFFSERGFPGVQYMSQLSQ